MINLSTLVTKLLQSNSKFFVRQIGKKRTYNISEISKKINNLYHMLKSQDIDVNRMVIGIAMNSSIEFLIADLMSLTKSGISLPVPLEFTDEQIKSLLKNADYCLVGTNYIADRINKILPELMIILSNGEVIYNKKDKISPRWPDLKSKSIIKIVHTSGTTSSPKGVMISDKGLCLLVKTLINIHSHMSSGMHYLSIVPLSLLIEQVLGLYLPLLTGGSLTLLSKDLKPYGGGQAQDPLDYLNLFKMNYVNLAYMPPKLLEELNSNLNKSSDNSFFYNGIIPHIITGGAKVNSKIIDSLEKFGVKVYEAYGLSENSSIVSINTLRDRKIGSPGKILSYIKYKIVNGELRIKGPTLSPGYLVKDLSSCDLDEDGYLKTGDIVEIDKDEYLFITGRLKNLIILSNARNVSPEWVESIIKDNSIILDALVFGDGEESLTALVLPKFLCKDDSAVKKHIKIVNNRLPDFVKITKVHIINNWDEIYDNLYTVTGRPRRDLIAKRYLNIKEEDYNVQ